MNSHYKYVGEGLYVYTGPDCRPPPEGHQFKQDRNDGNVTVYRCVHCGTEYGKEK